MIPRSGPGALGRCLGPGRPDASQFSFSREPQAIISKMRARCAGPRARPRLAAKPPTGNTTAPCCLTHPGDDVVLAGDLVHLAVRVNADRDAGDRVQCGLAEPD